MRAQNYADVFVTPYMRDMAIKSYPMMYEGYQVIKSFVRFMSVLLQALWAQAKQWAISLGTIVMNIAKKINFEKIRTQLQTFCMNAARRANEVTLKYTGVDVGKHMVQGYLKMQMYYQRYAPYFYRFVNMVGQKTT